MRGGDARTEGLFCYVSCEQRVPQDHPLTHEGRLSLEALARYPLITYDAAFAGRTHIDEAFAARDIQPDIVLAAAALNAVICAIAVVPARAIAARYVADEAGAW